MKVLLLPQMDMNPSGIQIESIFIEMDMIKMEDIMKLVNITCHITKLIKIKK